MMTQTTSPTQPELSWLQRAPLKWLVTNCSYILPVSKYLTKENVRVTINYSSSTCPFMSTTCWMNGNSLQAQECEITAHEYERSYKECLCLQNRKKRQLLVPHPFHDQLHITNWCRITCRYLLLLIHGLPGICKDNCHAPLQLIWMMTVPPK